jgi:hypothetical protein
VTHFVVAVPDVDARDADDVRRGPEFLLRPANVVLEDADQRAEDANGPARAAIVVSGGQKLSAECINVVPEAADEHSR